MAIHLDIHGKQLNELVELHYLPAEIETNVEAEVNEYFNIYTSSDNAHLTNSMRGFPLDGNKFQVPSNLQGIIFQDTPYTSDAGFCRLLRVNGMFKNLTYWNYDKVPSAADAIRQALKVLLVVDELSKPVSAEEIAHETDLKLESDMYVDV